MATIQELAKKYEQEMVANRRYLHAHPEIGGTEENTTAFVMEKLKEMGLAPYRLDGLTGCVAVLEGGKGPGNVIMLRADIDALPVKEMTGLPFASENEGIMHACGHDFHTSSLLGAARILTEIKDELKGTVKFCFQPAEEVKGKGACEMMEKGILENPKVDFLFGAHVSPLIPVGTLCCEPGPESAYPDFFNIVIHGKGCHGSQPHQGKDPIRAAVAIYHMLSDLSLNINMLEPHVIQVCKLQAGTAYNIVPDEAVIGGTVRTLTPEIRQLCKDGLAKIVAAVEANYGVTCEMTGMGVATPPVVNHEKYTPRVHNSFRKFITTDIVTKTEGKMGGEDFSFFQQTGVPGVFVNYGVASPDTPGSDRPLHNPGFSPDEGGIVIGAMCYAQVAVDYLAGEYED